MALLGWVAPDEDLKGRTENTSQRMGFMFGDKITLDHRLYECDKFASTFNGIL